MEQQSVDPQRLKELGASPGDLLEMQVWPKDDPARSVAVTPRVVDVNGTVEFEPPAGIEGAIRGKILSVLRPGQRPADLYQFMRQHNLAFPREVVTRYLLSMATKPFVILTGISGTGKTKIAQLAADYYTWGETVRHRVAAEGDNAQPEFEEENEGEQRFVVRVTRMTFRSGYLGIPKDYPTYFELPERGDKYPIDVDDPDGRGDVKLTFRNIGFDDPTRQQFRLTCNKALVSVLEEHGIGPGDSIAFEVLEHSKSLRLILPEQRDSEEDVLQGPDTRRIAFVSVRPDWSDNSGLLGYWNPLRREYAMTPVLKLLLRAEREWSEHGRDARPYFVILDEMNLAKVEHYFSDFLSVMESRLAGGDGVERPEELHLHDLATPPSWDDEDGETYDIPPTLRIAPNVCVTGTVNVDETTYMFSPKVLDRANVIEFHEVELEDYLAGGVSENVDGLCLSPEQTAVLNLGANRLATAADAMAMRGPLQPLVELNNLLRAHNRHFGYRVVNEVAAFMQWTHKTIGTGDATTAAALDVQVLQKVLPKLSGTREQLHDLLTDLERFLGSDGEVDAPARFPRSHAKIVEMRDAIERVGFVSFVQ